MERNIILLHGALGSSAGWHAVAGIWDGAESLLVPDLPGHGDSSPSASEASLAEMVSYLEKFIKENISGGYVIIGYSMGGYIALKFASSQPENLKGIITIGTKFNWNPEIADIAAAHLTKENLNGIWEKLSEEHGSNAENILETTQQILRSVGADPLTKKDLSRINVPVKLLRGDRDNMVTHEETQLFASYIPDSETDLLVNQPHLLQKMDARVLKNVLKNIRIC